MSKRATGSSPIHVCTLTLSPLNVVKQQLEDEEHSFSRLQKSEQTEDMVRKMDRLRWVKLSMSYYRQVQLQNVFQHLGDKGANPKFRAVRMRPLFNQWKREILRQNWEQLRGALDVRSLTKRLEDKKEYFAGQRTELTSRYITNLPKVTNPPLQCLVDIDGPLRELLSFQTPNSNRPGFYNQGYEYCASDAVKTLSEVPEDDGQEEWYAGVKSRGLDFEPEPEPSVSSKKSVPSSAPPPKVVQPPVSQRKVEPSKIPESTPQKGSNNTMMIVLISVIVLIIAFIVMANISSTPAIPKPTPTPIPTPTPTPVPTPTPTPIPTQEPAKGFFSFLRR